MRIFIVAPECLDLGLRVRALILKGIRIEDASRELRAEIDEEARRIREQFDRVADIRSMRESVSIREIIRVVGAKPKNYPPSTQKLFEYAWKHGTLPETP